jgi:hypothetical protein
LKPYLCESLLDFSSVTRSRGYLRPSRRRVVSELRGVGYAHHVFSSIDMGCCTVAAVLRHNEATDRASELSVAKNGPLAAPIASV